jgi:uncharacterized FlaG/YvyC family protein
VADAKGVRTEVSSEDRDANGRRDPEEQTKDQLNEEEMQKAKDYLDKLEGLKANGLAVEIELKDGMRIFLIKDASGIVVRRIPEWEMRPLIADSAKKTGQIFDKSA